MTSLILQFGTSRFLQAHADLMLSEARDAGQTVGEIMVVETTGSPASRARIAAFAQGHPVPVHIRGLANGKTIDDERMVGGISLGLSAREDITRLREQFISAGYILSNTGDRGYETPENPQPTLEEWSSFPELLTALLHERFRAGAAPVTLLPCELVPRNGDVLRGIAQKLAQKLETPGFVDWLDRCIFVNALVDRIVSAPIEPVGAVAEPYALWAMQAQTGFVPPARHPQISIVADIDAIERRKLFILNLGHTLLAQRWIEDGGTPERTVREMVSEQKTFDWLNDIVTTDVLPAFAPIDAANLYWAETLERFANPFLDHKLADIATNHDAKIARRVAGFLDWAAVGTPVPSNARLRQVFAGAPSIQRQVVHAH